MARVPATPPQDCVRFQGLIERRLGTTPTHEEQCLLDEHGAACQSCRALQGAVEMLAQAPPVDHRQVRAITYSVLGQVAARRRKRLGALALAAGLAAVVVAGTQVSRLFRPRQSALLVVAGAVHEQGGGQRLEILSQKAHKVRVGPQGARVRLPEGGLLALRANARVTFRRERRDAVVLRLTSGATAARVKPGSRAKLIVETALARVEVVGTIFSVRHEQRRTRVEVVRGTVHVYPHHDKLGPTIVRSREVYDSETGQAASLSATRLEHLMRLTADDLPARGPWAGAESTRADAVGREEPRPAEPPKTRPKRPAPGKLLDEARDCRTTKDWPCARRAYRRVIKLHPGTGAARISLVALGDIELGHLNRPDEALTHFGDYLRAEPDGALAPQALWGKARALQALGQAAQERRTLKELLTRFPLTSHAERCRERLGELDR